MIDLQTPEGQVQATVQIEQQVDLNELREREQAVKKMEGDIYEVNQIFKELATMVHSQGEVIDSIEANVEAATMNVSEGTQQVAKARDYQVSVLNSVLNK